MPGPLGAAHERPWRARDEERANRVRIPPLLRLLLDDLTFVVTHFLPRLNRDTVYRDPEVQRA
ncbi:hypothetical protein [Methylorubrum zatmanii]